MADLSLALTLAQETGDTLLYLQLSYILTCVFLLLLDLALCWMLSSASISPEHTAGFVNFGYIDI